MIYAGFILKKIIPDITGLFNRMEGKRMEESTWLVYIVREK
jgi:hypothetical protein